MLTIADAVRQALQDVDYQQTLDDTMRPFGLEQFRGDLERLDVARDLSSGQQDQLCALVLDWSRSGRGARWLDANRKEQRAWFRNGQRWLVRLRMHLRKATAAIETVRGDLNRMRVMGDPRLDREFDAALTLLDSSLLTEAESLVSKLRANERAEIREAMCALYDFFVNDCRLHPKHAEIRVGKIGNHFWDWDVAVIERSSTRDDVWKGCEAVRKAIASRRNRPLDKPTTIR